MRRLHLFNPSHEMALAANTVQYTPTKAVAEMERRMCRLPLRWAEADDVVLTPDGIIDREGTPVPLQPDMVPAPWGWNKAVKHRFLRLGVAESLMPTDAELDLWRTFASRKWAAQMAEHLYESLCNMPFLVENHIRFCSTDAELDHWMALNEGTAYILKSEYSSSGRGNSIGKASTGTDKTDGNSIGRRRHAPLLVDRFYAKTVDFAIEYEIKETEVCYLGLSVFKATREGRYESNYVLPQAEMEAMIVQHIAGDGRACLRMLIDTYTRLFRTHLLGRYRGFVGIDMLATTDGLAHPCIEINLRMNMGVVALLQQTKP